MVSNIILCVLGTLGFCVLLNMPKNKIWLATLGAIISSSIFEILDAKTNINIFWSTLISIITLEIYSEIMARIVKIPATAILLPSTIPLLPGGFLFYTMNSVVSGKTKDAIYYAKQTILVAFALAMGSVVVLIGLNIIRQFTKRR